MIMIGTTFLMTGTHGSWFTNPLKKLGRALESHDKNKKPDRDLFCEARCGHLAELGTTFCCSRCKKAFDDTKSIFDVNHAPRCSKDPVSRYLYQPGPDGKLCPVCKTRIRNLTRGSDLPRGKEVYYRQCGKCTRVDPNNLCKARCGHLAMVGSDFCCSQCQDAWDHKKAIFDKSKHDPRCSESEASQYLYKYRQDGKYLCVTCGTTVLGLLPVGQSSLTPGRERRYLQCGLCSLKSKQRYKHGRCGGTRNGARCFGALAANPELEDRCGRCIHEHRMSKSRDSPW